MYLTTLQGGLVLVSTRPEPEAYQKDSVKVDSVTCEEELFTQGLSKSLSA
jgi:hypothetical protein